MTKAEKRKLTFSGYSSAKGVTFYGRRYIVGAYIDEITNDVRTIVVDKKDDIFTTFKELKKLTAEGKSKFSKCFDLLKKGLFLSCLIIVSILIENFMMNLNFFYIFYGFIQISIVAFLIYNMIYFKKQSNEVTYFHGAEHMVANAFDKKGFIPSVEEIKKYSRFHPRCGISIFTNLLFAYNVFYVLSIFFHILIPPIICMYYISSRLPTFNPYSVLFQFIFTTKKPRDKEILVAKTAYDRLLILEKGDNFIMDNEEVSSIRYESIFSIDDDIDSDNEEFIHNKIFIEKELEDIIRQEKIEKVLFANLNDF